MLKRMIGGVTTTSFCRTKCSGKHMLVLKSKWMIGCVKCSI